MLLTERHTNFKGLKKLEQRWKETMLKNETKFDKKKFFSVLGLKLFRQLTLLRIVGDNICLYWQRESSVFLDYF